MNGKAENVCKLSFVEGVRRIIQNKEIPKKDKGF